MVGARSRVETGLPMVLPDGMPGPRAMRGGKGRADAGQGAHGGADGGGAGDERQRPVPLGAGQTVVAGGFNPADSARGRALAHQILDPLDGLAEDQHPQDRGHHRKSGGEGGQAAGQTRVELFAGADERGQHPEPRRDQPLCHRLADHRGDERHGEDDQRGLLREIEVRPTSTARNGAQTNRAMSDTVSPDTEEKCAMRSALPAWPLRVIG